MGTNRHFYGKEGRFTSELCKFANLVFFIWTKKKEKEMLTVTPCFITVVYQTDGSIMIMNRSF